MNIGYVIKFQKASGLHVIYNKQPPIFRVRPLLVLLNISFFADRPDYAKFSFSDEILYGFLYGLNDSILGKRGT